MKDFRCPFCLEKFSSRAFLLNVHTPKCHTRENYFSKLLEPQEMELIRQRVEGSTYKVEVKDTKKFIGKAIAKDEHKAFSSKDREFKSKEFDP